MNKEIKETVIVSAFFDENKKGAMLVGKKKSEIDVDVINAFKDEEAWQLYQKLFIKRDK